MIQALTPDPHKNPLILMKPLLEQVSDITPSTNSISYWAKQLQMYDSKKNTVQVLTRGSLFLYMDMSFSPLSGIPIPAASSASSCVCGAGPDITFTLQSSKGHNYIQKTPQFIKLCYPRNPSYYIRYFTCSASGNIRLVISKYTCFQS